MNASWRLDVPLNGDGRPSFAARAGRRKSWVRTRGESMQRRPSADNLFALDDERLVDRAGAWNAVAQAARRSTRRLRAIAKDLQAGRGGRTRWRVNIVFIEVAKANYGPASAGLYAAPTVRPAHGKRSADSHCK